MIITDTSATLERGQRYLLFFHIPVLSADIQRKISDGVNIQATFANKFLNKVDFELQGTAVRGDGSEFIALVKVQGTPLIALVNPIVQIIFIVTAGALLLSFLRAVLVPATASVGQSVEKVAEGIEKLGEGAGTGLKFGLPLVAAGVSVILVITLIAARAGRG